MRNVNVRVRARKRLSGHMAMRYQRSQITIMINSCVLSFSLLPSYFPFTFSLIFITSMLAVLVIIGGGGPEWSEKGMWKDVFIIMTDNYWTLLTFSCCLSVKCCSIYAYSFFGGYFCGKEVEMMLNRKIF